MVDICKCNGFGCKKKDTCFRFLAEENPYRQSYAIYDPDNCDSYWEVKTTEEKDKLNKEWEF